MSLRLVFLVGIIWISVIGCSTNNRSNFPCYDGWNIDGSGESQVWAPNQKEIAKMAAFYSPSDKVACYHKMPSGMVIILLNALDERKFISLMPSGDTYVVVETGFIVTAR